MKDTVWPVKVLFDGEPAMPVLMNRKAFRKSRESGVPWIVHPLTGRVLPWPGEPKLLSLAEVSGGFELGLPGSADSEPYGKEFPPEVNPDDRSDMVSDDNENGGDITTAGIMDNLSVLIARRHETMPGGSYTTHLFEQGLDKILKKTGEEAVELLLARNSKDVIYESADLVYHLLVLLEASGLQWSDVTRELARRHSE